MAHKSAHREMQDAVQAAYDRGFGDGRTVGHDEAFAFLIEYRDSALTRVEIERAFAERFFVGTEQEEAGE